MLARNPRPQHYSASPDRGDSRHLRRGAILNTAKGYLQQDVWLAVAAGTAIFVTVLGFNFLGDAIRDALDPRLTE